MKNFKDFHLFVFVENEFKRTRFIPEELNLIDIFVGYDWQNKFVKSSEAVNLSNILEKKYRFSLERKI